VRRGAAASIKLLKVCKSQQAASGDSETIEELNTSILSGLVDLHLGTVREGGGGTDLDLQLEL